MKARNSSALILAAAVGALYFWPKLRALTADPTDLDSSYEDPSIFDSIAESVVQTVSGPVDLDPDQNPNVRAGLDTIAYSEGADYDTLFGGGTFDGYADHPRIVVDTNVYDAQGNVIRKGYKSSAAGRYQILARTWDDVAPKIGAPDFSPPWQDRAAVYLIHRRGGLQSLIDGDFPAFVNAVRKEWASLPGAGYGQPERKLASLQSVYQQAGGTVTV